MTAEGLELSAVAQDVGEAHEMVEAKYEGGDLTVAFNSQFLLEGIDAASGSEITVESIDPLKPAVLKGTDRRGLPLSPHAGSHLLAGSCANVSVVARLALTDFRCYSAVDLALPTGVTVVSGANGEGKTSLLEALDWAATTHSFRGVPDAALVRTGAEAAFVRMTVHEPDREQLMEAEIRVVGRNRVRLNRHPLAARVISSVWFVSPCSRPTISNS